MQRAALGLLKEQRRRCHETARGAERAAAGPTGLSHAGAAFQKHTRPARGVSSTSRQKKEMAREGAAVIKTGPTNDENSSPELTESSLQLTLSHSDQRRDVRC